MTTQNVIYAESAENVLTVPSIAIKGEGEEKYVEVLTKTGVQKKDVITGVSDGLNVEVMYGVEDGDDVIIARMSSSEISDKTASTKMRGPRL
jgi:macrolide-specific efflux system membrane fusion protein